MTPLFRLAGIITLFPLLGQPSAAQAQIKPSVIFAQDGVVITDHVTYSTLQIHDGLYSTPERRISGHVVAAMGSFGGNVLDRNGGVFIGHNGNGGSACPGGSWTVLDLKNARIIPLNVPECLERMEVDLTGPAAHPVAVITLDRRVLRRIAIR